MALVIKDFPSKLRDLSYEINDYSISCQIARLYAQARNVSCSFAETFSIRGNEILQKKAKLVKIKCPSKVDVDNLFQSILAFHTDAKYCFEKAFKMKSSFNDFIETCRVTKKAKYNEIIEFKIEIYWLETKIRLAENEIQRFETEAQNEEREAVELDKKARSIRVESDSHRKHLAVSGLFSVAVGLTFGPIAGGLSMIPALVTVRNNLKNNFDNAVECDKEARSLRSSAEDKRDEANRLRRLMKEFQLKKSLKVNAMQFRKRVLDQLSETFDGLLDLERQLQISVSGFENAIRCVQDFQSAIHSTWLQVDAFELIKEIFEECPEEFSEEAHEGLFDLKIKWVELEQLILKYSDKEIAFRT